MTYDNLGRVLTQTTPILSTGTQKDSITKYKYDRNGNVLEKYISNNLTTDTTQKLEKVTNEYDTQNRLLKVTTYDNNAVENYTQYYYDAAGNMRRMYTGLSSPLTITGLDLVTPTGDNDYSVTKYTYDSLKRASIITDALSKNETFAYDRNGLLMQKTDRNSSTSGFQYNALGMLKRKGVTPLGKAEQDVYTYNYSATGAKSTMGNTAETTSYTYDDLGRVSTETTGDVQKTYTYDANNNLKTYIMTKNSVAQMNLSYEYDYKNRLHYVLDSGIIVAEYNYDANGNRSTITYNGQTTSYAYNLANMMTELENKKGTTTLSKYNYEYYTSGNQYKKTSLLDGVTTYAYDGLGRLASEITPNETLSYDYTDANNRKNLTVTNSTSPYVVNYNYDKNNRLTRQEKVQGSTTNISEFNYDYNGNLLNELKSSINPLDSQSESISIFVAGNGTGLSLYDYDGWNRQIKATVDNTTSSYTYNADGLRTSKTVNGTLTGFILEGGNVVAETNTSGITNKYVYGNGLLYRSTGGQKTFYNFNGHGDVTQLTDAAGSVIKNYTYDAFGVEKNVDANDTNPFRYCGEYFDKETGSIYLRARYYSPGIGRFTSEDSARQGTTWYAYCGNDPINQIDYSGEWYLNLTDVQYNAPIQPYPSRGYPQDQVVKTYDLYADNWFTLGGRTIISAFVPGGGVINKAIENASGVVGGNSATTWGSIGRDTVVSALNATGKQALKCIGSAAGGLFTAIDLVNGSDVVRMDSITFELFRKNGVSTTANSQESLENKMNTAYSYILSNNGYFSAQYDGYNTLFEIDNSVANAKNHDKMINYFASTYKCNLIAARLNGQVLLTQSQIDGYTLNYRNVLDNYRSRLDKVNKDFSGM